MGVAYLYILQSASTGRFYVGSTSDLKRRLEEHGRQHSPYTRHRGPWRLVYQEEFAELNGARQRERKIKSWKSQRSVQEVIRGKRAG